MGHYEVLGLSVGASAAAIRKAYRRRAKHEHPDKGGSDEQFQRLQQAYEVLADTGSRQQYDRTIVQEREQRRRQAEARKQEEERLAKQAVDRARFVAQQRQRMMEQEKAEAALRRVDGWAAQPSPALSSQDSSVNGRTQGVGSRRVRSAGVGRQPEAGRGRGRGETGSRNSRGYCGPTAHERSRYGYTDQTSAGRNANPGVYAGVTGMDSVPASRAPKASPQTGQHESEPLMFGSLEGRYYHKRHDCQELQLSSSVRTGSAYYFTVNEHKSRCPRCCGATTEATGGDATGESTAGCSGPTAEEAQEYLRRKLAREQVEERQARAAADRARYAGPTAEERARYGYAESPAASGRQEKSGVERVVHGMSNIQATLYGSKSASGSPGRATLHPLAAMGLSHVAGWEQHPRAAAPSASQTRSPKPHSHTSASSYTTGASSVRLQTGPELDNLLRRAHVTRFTFV